MDDTAICSIYQRASVTEAFTYLTMIDNFMEVRCEDVQSERNFASLYCMDVDALGGYPLVLRSPMVFNLLPRFLGHHLWNPDPQKGNANANNITLSAIFKAKPKLASPRTNGRSSVSWLVVAISYFAPKMTLLQQSYMDCGCCLANTSTRL